jgi:hypothetical protein
VEATGYLNASQQHRNIDSLLETIESSTASRHGEQCVTIKDMVSVDDVRR